MALFPSSHVVQRRPALAAYHTPDLLGNGSCTSHNPPLPSEPAKVGKLSRESSAESRLPLSPACCSNSEMETTPGQDTAKGEGKYKETKGKKKETWQSNYRNGEYPFISPNMHRGGVFSPRCRYTAQAPRVWFSQPGHGDLRFKGDLDSRSASPASLVSFDPISEERANAPGLEAGPIWTFVHHSLNAGERSTCCADANCIPRGTGQHECPLYPVQQCIESFSSLHS